jgi:hypothetical protein
VGEAGLKRARNGGQEQAGEAMLAAPMKNE